MIYLISFNPNLFYNSQSLHEHIINMSGVLDWWHYQDNVYLIETNTLDLRRISNLIRTKFPNLVHFITKVDLKDHAGLLPAEAWNWINRKNGYQNPLEKHMPSVNARPAKYDPEALRRALDELLKKK